MHWPLAISRNRDALRAVVAAIAALLAGHDNLIARSMRNAAFAMLRPAESAARRLIVIAARGLAVAAPVAGGFAWAGQPRAGAPDRAPAFRLFDPKGRFARLVRAAPAGVPRIRTFWGPSLAPAPPPPPASRPLDPGAAVGSATLRRRLAALEAALADLPRQARRLARWRARWSQRRGPAAPPPSPLRIGRPPGWRARAGDAVDGVLRDCHALALDALRLDAPARPDTS
jgi:hypothetical protein